MSDSPPSRVRRSVWAQLLCAVAPERARRAILRGAQKACHAGDTSSSLHAGIGVTFALESARSVRPRSSANEENSYVSPSDSDTRAYDLPVRPPR
jgi:hypothetical protein